jgi:hypothetical protein
MCVCHAFVEHELWNLFNWNDFERIRTGADFAHTKLFLHVSCIGLKLYIGEFQLGRRNVKHVPLYLAFVVTVLNRCFL